MLNGSLSPLVAPVSVMRRCSSSNACRNSVGRPRRQDFADAQRLELYRPPESSPLDRGQQRQHETLQSAVRIDGALASVAAEADCPAGSQAHLLLTERAFATSPLVRRASIAPKLLASRRKSRLSGMPQAQLPLQEPLNRADAPRPVDTVVGQPFPLCDCGVQGEEELVIVSHTKAQRFACQKNQVHASAKVPHGKPPKQSQRRSKTPSRRQQVLLVGILRSIMAVTILVIQKHQKASAICLRQTTRVTVGLFRDLFTRCSVGLHAAAASFVGRANAESGRASTAVSAIVRLVQRLGLLLKSGAASATEAAFGNPSESLAARAAFAEKAECLRSKLKTVASYIQTERHLTVDSPPTHVGSLKLTHEEALATACDLWASAHQDSPSKRIGVLQFQEILRKHLMMKEGSMYLLQQEPQGECNVHQEQSNSGIQKDPPQPKQLRTGLRPSTAQNSRNSIWGSANQLVVYMHRLAFRRVGILLSAFFLPFQKGRTAQRQQTSGKPWQRWLFLRTFTEKLMCRMLILSKILLQKLSVPCKSAVGAVKKAAISAGNRATWAVDRTTRGASCSNA